MTDEKFKDRITSCAKQIFSAAAKDDDLVAVLSFTSYSEKYSLTEEWESSCWDLIEQYRDLLLSLLEAIPPTAKKQRPSDGKPTERGRYLYNLKHSPTSALEILKILRSQLEPTTGLSPGNARERRGDLWEMINAIRPALRSAFTRAAFVANNGLLPEGFQHFEPGDQPLTTQETFKYREAMKTVRQQRSEMWSEYR